MPTTTAERVTRIRYEPLGGAHRLFGTGTPDSIEEVVLAGPANTGKSRACLEWVHLNLCRFPESKALMLRKTHQSLKSSGMVTYSKKVLHPAEGVKFFGGSNELPPGYRYPNGSLFNVGGMDDPAKVLSTEYDLVYVQQAEELAESDWETITTRLRWKVMPFQQLLGDCNPGPPGHWIKTREARGLLRLIESRHEDNPSLTPAEMAVLDRLTGHRYQRLRLGKWAAAEGVVYDGFDAAVHVIDRFEIPSAWPRYWAIDFGYTNPFVLQRWAEDPDGRLYRYAERYRTQTLVEDHAEAVLNEVAPKDKHGQRIWREPKPRAVICDHDAEGRATFERHTGLLTTAAVKAVRDGIQAVAVRLKPAADGRPRLFLLRDSVTDPDPLRLAERLPVRMEDEFEGYVWDTSSNRKQGEEPVKRDDHAMDTGRYLVAHFDLGPPPGNVRFLSF